MSYGTEAEFTAWLSGRGYDLPTGAVATAFMAIGSDYVDGAYEGKLTGQRVAWDQDRAWPRIGATAHGRAIPADVTPRAWIEASFYAAWSAANGTELSAVGGLTQSVKRTRVDTIEEEMFDTSNAVASGADMTPIISEIQNRVRPFLAVAAPAVIAIA